MRIILPILTAVLVVIAPFVPSGMITPAALADGCGIDRTHLMSTVDKFNWQTGVDQQCNFPRSLAWDECAIVDAAWVDIDGQRFGGPVFMIVQGPRGPNSFLVIEGQVVVPQWNHFAKRFYERIQVAKAQAERWFVPTASGNLRPRQLPMDVDLGPLSCPNDP